MHTLVGSLALAAALLGIPHAPVRPQDEVELRWRGKAGDVLRYRMTQEQTSASATMTEPMESVNGFVLRQQVDEVSPEGVGSLTLEYEAVRIELGGPVPMSYDSTRTGADAQRNDPDWAAVFEPLLAATVDLKVDPRFRVVEVSGLREALAAAFEELPNPTLAGAFEELFSDESLRRMVEVNVFPAEPLAVGETWQRDMEMKAPMVGILRFAFENTLAGVETSNGQRCARIGVVGAIALEADPAASGLPMKASLGDSELSGTMLFALDTGYLVESEMEAALELVFASGGGTDVRIDMTMRQRMVRIGEDDPLFE